MERRTESGKATAIPRVVRYIGLALMLQLPIVGSNVAAEDLLTAQPGSTLASSALMSGVRYIPHRHTLKGLRDKFIVKQQLDYSCGAAALATLMRYYFGDDTTEQELLDLLNARFKSLTPKQLARKKRVGFSLLDLKTVAEQKGYRAAGFELKPEQLEKLAAPVIVYVHPLGYHHFAVLRGIAGDRALLADPSRGNLSMHTARFAKEYGGVVFALGRAGEGDLARYPLDMSRLLEYAPPEKERVIRRLNRWEGFTINMAAWFRPF